MSRARWMRPGSCSSCLGLVVVLAATGCGRADRGNGSYFQPDQTLQEHRIPTYEEFKASAQVQGADHELYIVEWDYPINSEQALRSYYDNVVAGTMPKAAVRRTNNPPPDNGSCAVASPPPTCVDDIWFSGEQRTLSYCISNDFGANKSAVISAMAGASAAWHAVTNADYTYLSAGDGACRSGDPVPAGTTFKVSPYSGSACSFWPFSGVNCGGTGRTLLFDPNANFSGFSFTTVLTHELGHILGLHHEYQRMPEAKSGCGLFELRPLTAFDSSSIMGAPNFPTTCGLGVGSVVSANDGIGIRQLYGPPPAWIVSVQSML
jgi:serralysin